MKKILHKIFGSRAGDHRKGRFANTTSTVWNANTSRSRMSFMLSATRTCQHTPGTNALAGQVSLFHSPARCSEYCV